ncbi:hypothetical protein [Micromonospora inyonensis]|nr:hypothetical protein [Micromonospora inyonensis]
MRLTVGRTVAAMGGEVGFDGQHPVTFAPADPPRAGALLVWVDDGDRRVDLAVPPDGSVTVVTVRPVPIAEAVGPLLAVPAGAHPAAVFWAGAAREALHLAARGLVWPAVTAGGHRTWRIGPYGPADATRWRLRKNRSPGGGRSGEHGRLPLL